MRGIGSLFLFAIVLMLAPGWARAATNLLAVEVSPDVAISVGGSVVDDEDLLREDGSGSPQLLTHPGVPPTADVIGHHLRADGSVLLAFDTALVLPGTSGLITVRAGDVVHLDAGLYTLVFDASAAGIPVGARVDAVSEDGADLLLSFDTAVDFGGFVADDEDFVRSSGGVFSMELDGSALGIPVALDLDGADYIASVDRYALSLDGAGWIGGVAFEDEDVLEYDPSLGGWELLEDLSAVDTAWVSADTDALSPRADPDDDGLWDGDEAQLGTDPLDADSDDDGLSDGDESILHGTDPLDPDSDGDFFPDGQEIARGSDPLDPGSTPPGLAVPALQPVAAALLVIVMIAAAAIRPSRSRG